LGSLVIENLEKKYGSMQALAGINLEVIQGELVVFVGPSGCGKSTLLRIIAGLEEATAGRVLIGGQDVTRLAPAQRGIAMVFQTYALYPHLNVKNNMSLGLKQIKTPKAEIEVRVTRAATMLSLEPYLARRPAQLSGGQRQRVAIGRALVRQPELFLFDEPLSNLDAALRVQTRLEIAKLHHELAATMIYVTHDQIEAMTLADRIVVLNQGKIEQIGTPMQLYNEPVNKFVASFIGSPAMNFVDAAKLDPNLAKGAKTIGIRPEHLSVDEKSGLWRGRLVHIEHLGADTNLYVETEAAGLLCVRLFGAYEATVGAELYLTPAPDKLHLFNEAGQTLA